ncbi:hypothetical protein BLNAU_161 [Blattamonas nauphoetae]|uniref:Uncharacterized protein n=1 Tax=Blattamonas nauphoetae TaxID=2049346 RepID=A0ABQ9YM75_9EUKA|nr:hypothetical protein BLNAU_161 [Blattamonas nauphoetae]
MQQKSYYSSSKYHPLLHTDAAFGGSSLFETSPTSGTDVSLEKHILDESQKNGSIDWETLVEWFVEAVIGLDSRLKEYPSSLPLQFSDLFVDSTSIVRIRILQAEDLLIYPNEEKILSNLLSNVIASMIEQLVAMGHIQLANQTLPQLRTNLFLVIQHFSKDTLKSALTNINHLVFTFQQLIDKFDNLIVKNKGFISVVAQQALKNYSAKEDLEDLARFEAWMTILLHPPSENDISFLRRPCFRKTLISLQAQFQDKALALSIAPTYRSPSPDFRFSPPPHILSNQSGLLYDRPSSPSLNVSMPFHSESESVVTVNAKSIASTLSSSISDEVEAPKEYELPTTDQWRHTSTPRNEIVQVLIILHDLISAPPTTISEESSEQKQTGITQNISLDYILPSIRVDVNEQFSTVLFDETDNDVIVKQLLRCSRVIQETQSISCILDVDSFLNFLVWGLHSTVAEIRLACLEVLQQILNISPHFSEYLSKGSNFKFSFREGTREEQIVYLWINIMKASHQTSIELSHDEASGLLVELIYADLSDCHLLLSAIHFLLLISTNDELFEKQDLHKALFWFEYRTDAVSRIALELASGNSLFTTPPWLNISVSYLIFMSASFNTIFPWQVTQLILWEPTANIGFLGVHPKLFLNIRDRHYPDSIPVDLFFERILRNAPEQFFEEEKGRGITSSLFYLDCPSVGLHMILMRAFHQTPLRGPSGILNVIRQFEQPQHKLFLDLCGLYPPGSVNSLLTRNFREGSTFFNSITLSTFLFSLIAATVPPSDSTVLSQLVQEIFRFLKRNPEAHQNLRLIVELCSALMELSLPPFVSPSLRPLLPSRPFPRTLDFTKNFDVQISYLLFYIFGANRILQSEGVTSIFRDYFIPDFGRLLLSPYPNAVSVTLAFLARLVRVCSQQHRIQLVYRGFVDLVVRSVSQQHTLEDYENGVSIVGMLLKAIRQDRLLTHISQLSFDTL